MPNNESKRVKRAGQHPEAVARLQRSRERMRSRRQQARERERVVTGAVKQYIAAWSAIRACEARREIDIEVLRQKIEEVRESVDAEITGHRREQGAAAMAIRDQGLSDRDVAELLEIDPKQLRQLLTAVRAVDTAKQPRQADRGSRPSELSGQTDEPEPPETGSRTVKKTEGASGNATRASGRLPPPRTEGPSDTTSTKLDDHR